LDLNTLKQWIDETNDSNNTQRKLPAGDFHSVNTYAVYGDKYLNELYDDPASAKKMRSKGKATGLALLYGGSAFTLIDHLGVTEAEAEEIIKNFYSGVPNLKKLHNKQKSMTKNEGYTKNIFGGVRYLPDAKRNITPQEKADPKLRKRFWSTKSKAMRLALNYPIQSASATQLLLIIIAINTWIEQNRLNRYMGNLINTYRPYTRIIGLSKDDFDKLNKEELENELDTLPDGSHKFVIYQDDKVLFELDKLVTFNKTIIEKFKLEILF